MLKEHLQGAADLARSFEGEFRKEEWGYCCGLLHDLGKYSQAYQNKIKNNSNQKADHSTVGARV